ncbi:MAG: hypothetical protein KC549_07530 [Myxococcales bacterium]|nr:hypothetical protein [Myxococcales bacterium]MCB9549251.1 hypothetical protein [Myxococcales bacterium]
MQTLCLLGRLAALGLVASACAPAANMRPMTPMLPSHQGELGVAYTQVGPRPVGEDATMHGGQAWATMQPLTWLDISLVGAFASQGLAVAGLAVRWRAIEVDGFAAGIGAELGTGWVGVDLPVAVRVFDGLWAYSAPQLGTWGKDPTVRLPLGLDVEVSEELRIRGEAQMNYPRRDGEFDGYQRRLHLGMGMAFRL